MTTDTSITIPEILTVPVQLFVRSLTGRNLSQHTITAYETDLRQFLEYLAGTNMTITRIAQVERQDISEYLSHLSQRGRSGATRARKLAGNGNILRRLTQHSLTTALKIEWQSDRMRS